MAISTNYSHPVTVNGFSCWNCSEVAKAERHIDPTHPQSGPFDMNADSDPARKADGTDKLKPTKQRFLADAVDKVRESLVAQTLGYSAGGLPNTAEIGALVDISA